MIIPVIIGAFALGGAFNYYDLEPKGIYQIFDYNAIRDNILEKEFHSSDGKYRVVESAEEAFKVLRIQPDIALKSMNGEVGVKGHGRYINQVINRQKVVEILISYEIVKTIRTFPTTIEQGKGWQSKPQRLVGTHYVNAIEYGGHLVISVQFKPNKPEYVAEVKSIVQSRIAKEGSLDQDFFSKLEQLSPVLADKASLSLLLTTTVGSFSIPTALSDVKRVIDEFPSIVESFSKFRADPLKISLEDLHTVQLNFSEFTVSREVEQLLHDIESKYDDIRIAKQEYRKWESEGSILPPAQEKEMDNYLRRLKRANRAITLAVSNLNITGNTSQFDDALKAYNYDDEEVYYRYTKELEELIKNIDGKSIYRSIYSSLLAIQEQSRSY